MAAQTLPTGLSRGPVLDGELQPEISLCQLGGHLADHGSLSRFGGVDGSVGRPHTGPQSPTGEHRHRGAQAGVVERLALDAGLERWDRGRWHARV